MIKHIKVILYKMSIKNKMLYFTIIVAIFFAIQSIYLIHVNQALFKNYENDNNKYLMIIDLKKKVVENNQLLNKYFRESDIKNLVIYNESVEEIDKKVLEILDKTSRYDEKVLLNSVNYSLKSYYAEANKAIRLHREDPKIFPIKANRIHTYINSYINAYNECVLESNTAQYYDLLDDWSKKKTNYILRTIAITLMIIVISIAFSRYISNSITSIIEMQKEFLSEEINVSAKKYESTDELKVLNESFKDMKEKISWKFQDMNEKSIMEARLHQEKYKNLEMQKSLDEARLVALQTQINPHFLFNTLNVISRKAMFKDADTAVNMVQALSKLFRHALKENSKLISIEEELKIIEEYVFIQKVRFREKVNFVLQNDIQSVNGLYIPPLLIQPLIENSIKHGLEPKEEPGMVRLHILEDFEKYYIHIEDDGVGIDSETLKKIQNSKLGQISLGLQNVRERIRIYYGHGGDFKIESEKNMGTRVTISIKK